MNKGLCTRVAESMENTPKFSPPCKEAFPSRKELVQVMQYVREIFFAPYYCGDTDIVSYRITRIERVSQQFQKQLDKGMCFSCGTDTSTDCKVDAAIWTESFIKELPRLRDLLEKDVEAALFGDPAAESKEEIVLSYPSVEVLIYHRVAHLLYTLGVPLIPRILSEIAHSRTGIDIHPAATIGEHFFIDHGTGVVIGATTIIGNYCRIYQGVTLGAAYFKKNPDGSVIRDRKKRHPTLEDRVIVYAEATILGDITIGEGAVIGGNVWVAESVEPGGKLLQQCCTKK